MDPPEQPPVLSEVQIPPLPVTVKPAVEPVVSRTMPLLAPLVEMLRNVIPLAPMVVLAT